MLTLMLGLDHIIFCTLVICTYLPYNVTGLSSGNKCNQNLHLPAVGLHVDTTARSYASAEYWIHFTPRFGGVHAFGYNSAESEPI